MNDYIERDVAINAFCSLANALNSAKEKQPFTVEKITISGKISGIYLCKGIIRTTKSADVAPVRHGEWIHPTEYGLNLPEHYCSECGAWEYSDTESNYCPNCGARMDGEDE